MIRKFMGEAGFILTILGVGCADSPSIVCPVGIIAVGMALMLLSARQEAKYSRKKRGNGRRYIASRSLKSLYYSYQG